jgi:colanic acid biosynthesis glycosyl transferase WcaI
MRPEFAHRPDKIVFVNRYFDPDQSATSQMLTDLSRGMAVRGINVHVICSRQLYVDPRVRLPPSEIREGVTIHRATTTRFGRARLLGRAFDYASFYVSAGLMLLRHLNSGDVLVAKTDPPLISILAAAIAHVKSAALVNWQQDVFPEIASHLGANPLPRWLDSLLRRYRDASLRAAKMNVLIGNRMLEYFRERGIPVSQLCVIENWADAAAITPIPTETSALRARLGLNGRFIVCYSGNLGRAHEFDTLLAAAEQLRSDPSIVFLVIGDGAKMGLLRQGVAERALDSFRFLPYQPREELSDSLAAADVHLVSLLPALEGLIMPSKLYGILAAGRPLVFIGDRDGDIARVIGRADCGIAVNVNASDDLVAAIRRLQREPDTRMGMGSRARQTLESHYSLDNAVARWIAVIDPGHKINHGTIGSGQEVLKSR